MQTIRSQAKAIRVAPPSLLPADDVAVARRVRVIVLALGFGTLLLFARAIGHDFVNYDDPDYVTANPQVRAGLSF